MTPEPLYWPHCVLKPNSIRLELKARSVSGGVTLSGLEPVIGSGAGIWTATFTGTALNTRQHVLAFRALSAKLSGRVGTVLVPAYDIHRAPWPVVIEEENVSGDVLTTHSDLTTFSDGSHYAQAGTAVIIHERSLFSWGDVPLFEDGGHFADGAGFWVPVINVTTYAAPKGSTTILVDIVYAGLVQAGQHFSIDGRLYRIIDGHGETGTVGLALTIAPPLREDIALLQRCEFDRPVCMMRMATDDAMEADLYLWKFGAPASAFVEAFAFN